MFKKGGLVNPKITFHMNSRMNFAGYDNETWGRNLTTLDTEWIYYQYRFRRDLNQSMFVGTDDESNDNSTLTLTPLPQSAITGWLAFSGYFI